MDKAARILSREARPCAGGSSVRRPPPIPVAAGGKSRPPRCRIFLIQRGWALELESTSAGEHQVGPASRRLTFPSLAAAIAHAEDHGYQYRIILSTDIGLDSDRRAIAADHPT